MENMEFAVGTAAELRERFGWSSENWMPPVLNLNEIPAELHDIVPWVLRFGVSCDVTRHDVADKTSREDIQALDEAVSPRHKQIENFVNDHDAGDFMSEEKHAFGKLLIFHSEECDGPGIRPPLMTFVEKCQQNPDPGCLRRLRSHYASTIKFIGEERGVGHYVYFEPYLLAAEALLGITSPAVKSD